MDSYAAVCIAFNTNNSLYVGNIVNNKWKITEIIFDQKFSKIYKALNIISNDVVIIKTDNSLHIQNESEVYKMLVNIPGFPIVHYMSDILVMEYIGTSLFELYKQKYITLNFVLKIASQMIDRISVLHTKGFIHCDIKPGNFLMSKDNLIYLIDFGVSHAYINKTGKHITCSKNVPFRGTYKYSSINALNGYKQSRRDDMESLGYVLISFLIDLPWSNIKDKQKIIDIKTNTAILTNGIPIQFKKYMDYIKSLKFKDEPDYEYLKSLFMS